ncbi:MAG: VWA domain-containing protein [Bacilli bacterium]|nr:VWA domain-containing protein [Bacilli bacterium]
MNRNKKSNNFLLPVLAIILVIFFWSRVTGIFNENGVFTKNTFHILASTSTRSLESDLKKFAKKNKIDLEVDYYGDLEIVNILNDNSGEYDAVWLSNSLWLYMLDNSNLTSDSKSIVMNPVVLGIKKSKAESLGLVGKDVYNKDILETVKSGNLKYVMASVTKTNTGATTYLNFLNSLAGNPEVLTEEMLDSDTLRNDLKSLFQGVERVSGDEDYLKEMYLNGEYDAIISYESSLISLNEELVKNKKEALYLIYPVDGVAINDMPFAYINNDLKDTENKNKFLKLQEYLRSDKVVEKMEKLGYRSWYGGIKTNVDKNIFNPDWGIDTSKYLKDMKYPSKKVITKAINIYIEELRKPTHVVFCLDVSGSMYGSGISELKDAMNYILNYETASRDNLQFSKDDKITVITFNSKIAKTFDTKFGSETNEVIAEINYLEAIGGTNIYDPSIKALEILKGESDDYTKTVILMTDGMSNSGYFSDLKKYYDSNKLNIPIYSITFGSSDEKELNRIATLTNAKVFDGKSGLKKAFTEVRSYN